METAERYVDGRATASDLAAAHYAAWGKRNGAAENACACAVSGGTPDCSLMGTVLTAASWARLAQANGEALQGLSWRQRLFRTRPAIDRWTRFDESSLERAQSQLLRDIFGNPFRLVLFDPRWRTSNVLDLARTIYEDRAFDRLPILADALMDAGCADEQVLGHCRGPGPHARGCWTVDLILGKQ